MVTWTNLSDIGVKMLQDCIDGLYSQPRYELNEWAEGFLIDLSEKVVRYKKISDGQWDKLFDIYKQAEHDEIPFTLEEISAAYNS